MNYEISENTEWLVEGLLPRGQTVILTSARHAGQTTLGIDLAYCLSTGDPFLGKSVTKGKTLLVNMLGENSIQTFLEKMEKRGISERFHAIGLIPELSIKNIDKASLSVDEFQPDLIIVNGLSVVSCKTKQASNEYAAVIAKINGWREDKSTSIIIIDNAYKRKKDLGLIDHFPSYQSLAKQVWRFWHLDYIENPVTNYDYWAWPPGTTERYLTICDRWLRDSIPIAFNPEDLSYSPSMGFFDPNYRRDINAIIRAIETHPGKSAKAIGKISGVSRVYLMLRHLDNVGRIDLVCDARDNRRKIYKAT